LGQGTLWVAYGLLHLISPSPICRPAEFLVGTPSYTIFIADSCSGYEGIGLIWGFFGVYLWLFRHRLRFPQAFLLLPMATVLMWLANAVRIAALVAVGTWVSPEVAMGGFHSQAGWLAFLAVGFGLVAVTRHRRYFTAADPAAAIKEGSRPTAAYVAPLLALVATAMLTGAVSGKVDKYYALRVVAVVATLWVYRREYVNLDWAWTWPAVGVGAGVFVVWMALEPAGADSPEAAAFGGFLAGMPPALRGGWLLFRVVGSVVTVPLAEELAFRGYLIRRLQAAEFQTVPPGRFTWASFLLSSALFGTLHGRWLAGTLAGMAYALVLYRRGRLGEAVLAHATTNALIAAYVLATGSWALWS
jgi:exosortase E/protease (VPEID-CTERM system)